MLVLSRKLGEKIVINDDIVIEFLSQQPGRIKLGIHAPREVGIRRGELEPKNDQRRTKECV